MYLSKSICHYELSFHHLLNEDIGGPYCLPAFYVYYAHFMYSDDFGGEGHMCRRAINNFQASFSNSMCYNMKWKEFKIFIREAPLLRFKECLHTQKNEVP